MNKIIVAVIFLMGTTCPPCSAGNKGLDTTFGNKGIIVETHNGVYNGLFNGIIIQPDGKIIAVLAMVYLLNLSLLVLLIGCFFAPKLFVYWLMLLIVKTGCELSFMMPVARFFNQEQLLAWFLVMQPLHIVYTVIAGWLGLVGKYQWKERKVK